ncbi:MAG: hypothetical protein NVSMB18_04490 [Acetobacteraceae bacterium]
MGPVIVDSNLMLLLVVGTAKREYIASHKNTAKYGLGDLALLETTLSLFSDFVLLPCILTEVSNLARQVSNPARERIQAQLRTLTETCPEVYLPSLQGMRRHEYDTLGLTDALILELCGMDLGGTRPHLLTHDMKLAVTAQALGLEVMNFAFLREEQS